MKSHNPIAAELRSKRCKSCHKDTLPLTHEQVQLLLPALPGWETTGKEISKIYPFKNYYETMAFVNALAFISHHEDHHPDLTVEYNKCTVRYSSHEVGGLSENDFICAAKAETLITPAYD
jgi:4a-hydroxytetrahydrobiopterin dehydratase